MAVSDSDISLLTQVVGTFENSGDPYEGVSGDFDGMGISCGVLQWNIGSNSLQPLVRAAGQAHVLASMPTHGQQMWSACTSSVAKGLAIVRGWQSNRRLAAKPKAELKALMGSQRVRGEQDKRIRVLAEKADGWASAWAQDHGGAARTTQELVWFFDIATQNGGMKDLGYADVKAFRTANTPDKSDDVICDWLAGLGKSFAGYKDCRKNAELWRNAAGGAVLDLLILSYLRAQKSGLRWRGDVANRKGTLAVRRGFVHQSLFDFNGVF